MPNLSGLYDMLVDDQPHHQNTEKTPYEAADSGSGHERMDVSTHSIPAQVSRASGSSSSCFASMSVACATFKLFKARITSPVATCSVFPDQLQEVTLFVVRLHLKRSSNQYRLLGNCSFHQPRPFIYRHDHLEVVAALFIGHRQKPPPEAGLRSLWFLKPGSSWVNCGHNDGLVGWKDPILNEEKPLVTFPPLYAGKAILMEGCSANRTRRADADEVDIYQLQQWGTSGDLLSVLKIGCPSNIEGRRFCFPPVM
mmetsp:Transcript_41731/g.89595  ORF Transcript_41731/g.89595 Transcript_41731/m.89595 type:complete len:254 (-) Transcript_41731:45-806(-)